jgi:flagellar biosynthesis protein FliR
MLGALPFVPFLHSADDVIFFTYILARVTGMFVISPMLNNATISRHLKLGLAAMMTLLLTASLYPDYRGDNPRFFLEEFKNVSNTNLWLNYVLVLIKEFLVGYLIGFVYSLIFESLLVGGQLIGTMAGFSVAEMIDPMSNTSRPILAQFFVMITTLWMLSMDLHHEFFIKLTYSFQVVPIGDYSMPFELMKDLTNGAQRFFTHALMYIALPLSVLYFVTVGLGMMAKIMPEMNIFLVGFPIKIFIGFISFILSIGYFPEILQITFIEYGNVVDLVLRHIGGL